MATTDIRETGGAVVPEVEERNLYRRKDMLELMEKVYTELERAKLAGAKGNLDRQTIYNRWAVALASLF